MRILGIDLGSTSVKAVDFDSSFGRYEIRDYYEQKVPTGGTHAEALKTLLAALPRTPDKVALCLPAGKMTFRNLALPTRDKKKIQASIGFELEDDLPFSLDDAAFDYSVLSTAGQTSQVHATATLGKYIEELLAVCTAAGIDPDMITTEAWAYRTLFNKIISAPTQEKPVLFVQIGHEHTTFYIHKKGIPVMCRQVLWGGRDVTLALGQKYSVPIDQAEVTKTAHGFVIPQSQREQATAEQVQFSATLLEPLSELLWHLKQARLTCKNQTQDNLSAIYLGGGTSLLPGLAQVIEEELQLPTQLLHPLSSLSAAGVRYSELTDANFVLAASVGLCLAGSERSTSINLRKGGFLKRTKSKQMDLKALRAPLTAAGVVTFSLALSLMIQSSVYKSRIQETDTQVEKALKGFFGQISSGAVRTYLSDIDKLRTTINKELTRQRELARLLGPNPKTPLNFVKDLSESIPKDTVVDLIQTQIGASASSTPFTQITDNTASLTFVISSPQVAEKLASILGKKLGKVERSKMEEFIPPGTNEKKWKITFSGKPTEDSYGR